MGALVVAAITVAFMHSFAPDHWVPLVAIAKGASWSMKRLAVVAVIAGVLHVVVSVLVALLAIWFGAALAEIVGVDAWRGNSSTWLLIVFGGVYGLWGLTIAARHKSAHLESSSDEIEKAREAIKGYATRRVIVLMLIMVIGPAEPIVPLLFAAKGISLTAMWAVGISYSIVLAGMIVLQSCLGYAGANLLRISWLERHTHSLAGLAIIMTGVLLLFMG
jgi:hypothetical protein